MYPSKNCLDTCNKSCIYSVLIQHERQFHVSEEHRSSTTHLYFDQTAGSWQIMENG